MVSDKLTHSDEKESGSFYTYYENSNVNAENMVDYVKEIERQQQKNIANGEIVDYEHCVYVNSSDSLLNLLSEDFSNKRVLTVTGSGEFSEIFAIKGAKEICSFDVSPVAAYYSELRHASILNNDFETHKKFFGSWKPEIDDKHTEFTTLIDPQIYRKIRENLTLDAQAYFDIIVDHPNLNKCDVNTVYSGIYRFRTTKQNQFNSLVGDIIQTEDEYQKLQEKCRNTDTTQVIWNAKDISELVKAYKPETMYISNIFVNTNEILENSSNLIEMGAEEVVFTAWAGTFTYAERRKHNLILIEEEDSGEVKLHQGSKLLWKDETSDKQVVLEILQIDPNLECGMLVKVSKTI